MTYQEQENKAPWEDAGDAFKDAAEKGVSNLRDKFQELEDLASQGTHEAKQKLLAEAQKHGLHLPEDMDPKEIKNKIKAALRNKAP